ncbi:MAG: hypothetical protein JKY24_07805 [Pseudomonadales bacterium]|nr:hypothetical protein [Pseudomonadales bacterium]
MLGLNAPEQASITVLGSGSKLIGGTRKTTVEKTDIHTMVLDGFFPLTDFSEMPKQRQSGVIEFGLNYTSDPAVSRHIASFLHNNQSACRLALGIDVNDNSQQAIPDTILFNGGMFNSALIADRVLSLFERWSPSQTRLLDNPNPDQAVAFGATAYALARRGQQTKIESGSARSYFLLIDSLDDTKNALCILPKGTVEDLHVALEGKKFSLTLGKPVSFKIVSTVTDQTYAPGEVVLVEGDRFVTLPPLVTVLEKNQKTAKKTASEVVVEIVANMTAVGTLQIQCVAIDGLGSWDLEFQLRTSLSSSTSNDESEISGEELPKRFSEVLAKVAEVYGKSDSKADKKGVKNLRPQLEKILGKKTEWDTPVLRALAQEISSGAKRRRRSNTHERLWNNLMGYCLRPGFGFPLDDWKVNELWNFYQQGVQFSGESQSWAEWWTLWRRVAGGLSEDAQIKIYKDIAKYINPGTARNQKVAQELKTRSYEDIVRLAAVLEHLPSESKVELGNWLVKRLDKAKEPDASWWALGRVGSRVPFHGSAHKVVPKEIAEKWITFLTQQDWSKNKSAALAASMIARKCGDRERDLDEAASKLVVDKLIESKCSSSWVGMVEQVSQLDAKDQQRVFGESLPAGLKLIN